MLPATPFATVTQQPTCPVPTGTVVINSPTGANYTYSDGGVYQGNTTFASLTPNSTYNITAQDQNTGCISDGFPVTVNAVPSAPAAPNVTSPSRCGPGIVSIAAVGAGVINWYADAALTDLLNTGNFYSPSILSTTTYYVTSTENTCTSTATPATAIIDSLPIPNLGDNLTICPGDSLILNPGVFSSYLWQDNSTLPTYPVTLTGIYSVIVTSAGGCQNSASVTVMKREYCEDIYFPSAFSPNGDGLNDYFGALGNVNDAMNYSLSIFNRWGQLVFSTTNPFGQWDGNYLGKACDMANYVWIANYTMYGKPRTQKGNLLLLR
jgi:gliding motility-associated-like protein